MVELRKRPAPKEAPASQPAAKRGSGAGDKMKKVVEKAKAKVGGGTSLPSMCFMHFYFAS